ncbi:MAG TPA: L,D-transpeptidase, partial [Thermoanaerobaculia bacterium]
MKTGTAFAFALLVSAAASAQIHLEVTVGGKTLDVRDAQNHVLASYQISPGMTGHSTPTGNFTIRKIVWNPAWVPPKAGWAKG